MKEVSDVHLDYETLFAILHSSSKGLGQGQHRGAQHPGSIPRLIARWTSSTHVVGVMNACQEVKLIKTRFERSLKTACPCFREIWMLVAGFTLHPLVCVESMLP